MFVVARTKYAILRLLLKLLLLSSIVNANLGAVSQTEIPNAIASTALPPPAATISATDYATSQLLASSSEASATAETQHPPTAAASRETLVNVYDYGLNDRSAVNDIGGAIEVGDNDGNIASATDMIEEHGGDESEFFAPTVATSIEQQDQPMVPPTTLSFANVVPVKNMADDSGATSTTLDYASPPYEAVDDKYVPSKPLNLTVLDVSSNSITMSWHPPKNQNGAIAGYHVFHIHENQTGVEIVKNVRNSVETTITFALPNLRPFTEYRVIVKAFTTKNEGDPSDQIVQRTDVAGPSAPIVVNVTCHSQESITIRWKRPYEFYNTIDFYIIKARLQGQDSHRDIRINASAKELESAMILQNLTTNSVYEVKVAAATFSVINPKKIILGKFSEAKKIPLQPNCEKLQPQLRQSHNDYNLAVLVGIIFSCFGIILIVMAFFLWSRKCFHAAYYYLDDPPHHPNVPQVDWEVPVEVGGEIRAAVPVNEFGKHVASLHADGDIGFSREYEAIQNECVSDDMPCENSLHPENKRKNRYLNITAYDHSRVHLHPTTGQKKSLDYINANFIDGYQKSRAFIGTQGPLPETFDCFWRMIWEQRVVIIVMITNLVERGRRKCDMYWPKDGTETYGVIQVKLIEEEVMSTYTVRTLQIKHMKLKKKKQCNSEKIVYQYHYTNWPDHGTPDHPLPVLNFVKKSSAANPPDAGPIVVHCSAGVGRTGTYIVLDAMLKQIQQKGVVNVFGFLRHIRIQRNFLVQTEEQYIFLHDALVEAIASGETNLRAEQIEELKNCTPYLENQYRNIIQFQTKDIHIASAMKQVNSIKNRGAIFPIEGSRVHLTPKPGEEGSDYINASWLHGFRRLRDFIVTQHPMTHTLKDFWQMVWDHNAQTIVLLSSLDEINFAQFWADEATPIESDYYRVKYLNKTNKSDYVSRDFVIQSIQDDYELTVKMLHCPSWPEMSNPNSIYDFIVDVHERCNDYRNGPIVIVDRYGGAQACTFCAISSLAIEMEYCNTANVYQYAKLYHNKRPGVWTSSEDIRLIYNILSFLPPNLQLLKRTALRTEFEDVTTVTPDLYSKICSNGNIQNHNNSSFTNSQNSSNCLNNQLVNQINQNNLISQSVPSNQNQKQNIAFNNPSQPPKQSQSPTPSSQTPPPLQRPPSPLPTSPPPQSVVVMSPTQITTAINPLTNTNVDNLNTNTNAATINMNGEWTNTSVPSSTTSSMNGDVQQLQQQQLQQQNQQIQQQQQQQQYQHQQMMALMNRQNQLQLQQQHQQQLQHQSPYIISPTNMVQHCGDDDAFVLPTAQTILTTSSPSPPSSPSLPPSPQSTLHFVDTENVARDSNCISSAPNTPLVGDGYAPLLTSNNSFSSSSSSSSTTSPNAHAQPPISDCCSGSGSSSSSTSSSTTSALSTSLTNGISNAHDNQTTVVTDAQNLDIVG